MTHQFFWCVFLVILGIFLDRKTHGPSWCFLETDFQPLKKLGGDED